MIRLSGKFEGWVVDPDEGMIWDDANNSYDLGEIRAIFYTRQFMFDQMGNKPLIRTLRQVLDDKISATQVPSIRIDWGDGSSEIVTHPRFGNNAGIQRDV